MQYIFEDSTHAKGKNNLRPTLLALAVGQSLLFSAANAATTTVNDSGDTSANSDGICTLREAVLTHKTLDTSALFGCSIVGAFGTNDMINFAPSISTVTLEAAIDIDKNMLIDGGLNKVIIEAGGGAHRLFRFLGLPTESETISFERLTMTKGNIGGFGSAFYARDITVNMMDCTVSGNTSTSGSGGGIAATRSILNIDNSSISNNYTPGKGGGISLLESTLKLVNSEVSMNEALDGAGISAASSTVYVNADSTISTNTATLKGGGIYLRESGVFVSSSTISNNSAVEGGGIVGKFNSSIDLQLASISNNSASMHGGGLHIGGGSLVTTNSSIANNISALRGGGLYEASQSNVTLDRTTVANNLAAEGGGVFNYFANLSIHNSTISSNSATSGAGAIDLYDNSYLALINSTLSNNSASQDGGIALYFSSAVIKNSILTNSVGDDCAVDNLGNSMVTADTHNIIQSDACSTSAQNIDPQLGSLTDNGGKTLTHNPLSGSPAIDMGNNMVCAAAPINNLDQRGEVRPVSNRCDIGAVEYKVESSFFAVPIRNGKTVIFEL